ncbi:MAG: MMPL family transporter [Bacteroidia bacterium]|nr:MMPL family transporter [Bacteroidia bacterium]MDW8158266.1 MMPL family transporter [Bacteroidia bacterium]
MWPIIADLILRFRIALFAFILVFTLFFGYYGFTHVEIVQEFVKVIPIDDPDLIDYNHFKKYFGTDGNSYLIALKSSGANWYQASKLGGIQELTQKIKSLEGVERVINLTNVVELTLDSATQKFKFLPIVSTSLHQPSTIDTLRNKLQKLPFYQPLLFNPTQEVTLLLVTVKDWVLYDKRKHQLAAELEKLARQFAAQQNISVHFGGLPFLRSYIARKLPQEMAIFSTMAILLTAAALFIFYRSIYAVLFPLTLLIISAVWTLGIIALLGYKITILTALLPPIIIILGIPPSIYMLSEYHESYKQCGDKIQALHKMILRLGLVTLMINANTAFGFLTLYFTQVVILQEFGLVAFLGTMAAYFLTIVLLPGFFSFLPPPSEKNLKHLEAPFIKRLINSLEKLVFTQKRWIYLGTFLVVFVSLLGIAKLQAVSFMADDIPRKDYIYTDLKFFESHFGGVMPFEIFIECPKKGDLLKLRNLKKIDELQQALKKYPEISTTLSLVDGIKWSRQALLDGEPSAYALPVKEELDFIARATPRKITSGSGAYNPLFSLVDSTYRVARITGFMQDVGSIKMNILLDSIQKDIERIFVGSSSHLKVVATGTTKIFLKANDYLIENLVWSLVATFLIIGLQMFWLFGSWKIMLISMAVNIVPLLLTAGIMGFLNIPIKPSTALIYELAFGIAIDNSIHILAAYRFERIKNGSKEIALTLSLRSTGLGIIYTSIVLFAGFSIFAPSAFGSTSALGILTSTTLLVALFSNLFLLPALILDLDTSKKNQPQFEGAIMEDLKV